MFSSIKKYIEKKKQPKTKEQLIKDVIAYSLAIVIIGILVVFFQPVKADAEFSVKIDTTEGVEVQLVPGDDDSKIYIDEYSFSPIEDTKEVKGFLQNISDTILEATVGKTVAFGEAMIEIVVKLVCNCFQPSLNPLIALERGTNVALESFSDAVPIVPSINEAYDEDYHLKIGDSVVIGSIWKFAMYFGIITATLIALFNLLLCIFGRSQDIKDSPAGIGFKYAIALLLMACSRFFMTGFINLYGDVWNKLIWGEKLLFTMDKVGITECFVPGTITQGYLLAFGSIGMSLASMTGPLGAIILLGALIVLLFMGFKLLSEFLKLFLEIVERYFVFFILIAFFPALTGTLVTNNSKKIFYAYIKMVYTQGFLLIVNSVFMALFVYILGHGGWTAGFLNYLAALAFLRVCQKVDAYMAQMGFNVVQTGAGLAGAIGGAGMGLMAAMRGMQALNKGRQNIGGGLKDLGLRTNNSGLAKAGAVFGASGRDIIGGAVSNEGLSQMLAEGQAANIANSQGHSGGGTFGSLDATDYYSKGGLSDQMQAFGMSQQNANDFCGKLQDAGYDASDIKSIWQNNDDATSFSVGDGSTENGGGMFATFNGNSSDGAEIISKSENLAAMAERDNISASDGAIVSSNRTVPDDWEKSLQAFSDSNGITSQLRNDAFANSTVPQTDKNAVYASSKMDIQPVYGKAGQLKMTQTINGQQAETMLYAEANNPGFKSKLKVKLKNPDTGHMDTYRVGKTQYSGANVKNTKQKPR